MPEGHGTHGTPWCDLPPKYCTDKIPPGWFVGCGWRLEQWIEACEEWKKLNGYENDEARVAALRFRLKGTVRDTSDAHKKIPTIDREVTTGDPPVTTTPERGGRQVVQSS